MNELPFVIWMLGYSIGYEFVIAYRKKCGFEDSREARLGTSAIALVIWIGIGALLWFNRK